MKKLIFTIVLLSSIVTTTFAYLPFLGKTNWTMYVTYYVEEPIGPEPAPYYYSLTQGGDTTIAGNTYKIIHGIDPLNPISVNVKHFIRENADMQKVYFYNKLTNTDQLLYDFTLAVGDSFNTYNPLDSSTYYVDSVEIITLHGVARKKIYSHRNVGLGVNSGYHYIEGIGRVNGTFATFNSRINAFVDFGFKENLSCVSDNTGLVFGDASCVSSLYESPNLPTITLTPNPATTSFTLSGIEGASSINVYDNQGKVITTSKATQATHQLDCSRFAAGIYFAKITTSAGIQTLKFIKN